jgi:hypothetical protein
MIVDYREDEGLTDRAGALAVLATCHPLRALADLARGRPGEPGLTALAPAALRLARDPGARVAALAGEDARASARRLAALAGRALDQGERS